VLRIQQNEKALLRLVPHRSVLNSNNRRLWHVLHDMLSMYAPPAQRLRRHPVGGFQYRVRDDVWWILTMKAAPGGGPAPAQSNIAFHIAVPTHLLDVLRIKLANHVQWNRCTLQDASLSDIALPEQADAYRLRLCRHDMFSLSFDYAEQTTPIRDLLHVSSELRDNDTVAVVMRLQAVARAEWRERADHAWTAWDQGSVPRRPGWDGQQAWRAVVQCIASAGSYAAGLLNDILSGIDNTFYRSRPTGASLPAPPLADPERQALLVNGDLSARTRQKRNLPAFAAGVHLLVAAPTESRRQMLAHSVAGAFGGLSGDNMLTLHRCNPAVREQVRRLACPTADWDPDILSTDEVGKIVQLPTGEVQQEFGEELESNRAVEIEIPRVFLDPSGIFTGTAGHRGASFPIHIPTGQLRDPEILDKLMTPRVLIGSPRMGKDMAAVNLIVESRLNHGIGAVILDVIDERNGHRGMADAVRDHLPAEMLVDLDLSDFDYPPYVGTANIPTARNERIAASQLADIITGFFLGDDASTSYQTASVLRECAKAVGGDLIGVRLMLTNPGFRARKLADAKRLGLDMTNMQDFHALGDRNSQGRQGQIAAPILVRLGEIMSNEALRPIFCQRPRREANLSQWLSDGKVVIYRVPNRDLGEMAVRTLAHWIVMTVFLTKQALGGRGAPTWLVLNEPHQFLSPGLVHFCRRLLAEGPKHRLAPVLLLQNFKLLQSPTLVEILMSSSLNWHLFRNSNIHVYEELREYLAPTFEPATAMAATPAYHFIACWMAPTGEYQTPFMMAAPPVVSARFTTRNNVGLTKAHSRLYGKPIVEIQREMDGRGTEA